MSPRPTEAHTHDPSTRPVRRPHERAFLAIQDRITPKQMAMLRAHYHTRGRAITATELARAVGYEPYHAANLQYGLLARRLREALVRPPTGTELDVLLTFAPPPARSVAEGPA